MANFNDFLNIISEAKAQDPKRQIIKRVKESIQEDLTSLFSQLESPNKNETDKLSGFTEQIKEEVHEKIVENSETVQKETFTEEVNFKTSEERSEDVTKYLRALPKDSHSFQQPIIEPVPKEFKAVQDKLKFLEQWVAKISSAGPGSGEVNLRWLDDIDRTSIANGRYLRYDQSSKKFLFDHPNAQEIGVLDYVQLNENGPGITTLPGTLSWNLKEDCLDVKQTDGSTLQLGLEEYIAVHNSTGSTLTNGSVVRFSGVYVDEIDGDYVPECAPHIANGSIPPLYTIGVLTNDIPNGQHGRATILGKVRDLNTTGSSSGETWVSGDILYVSPTNAGKLTKVKPTAPNIVVSVAAVLKVGVTDGILLVRPVIFPRLYYGSFSDTTDQVATQINTPYAININTTDIANGHHISNNSRVVAENSGLYNYQFSLQLSSSNSSSKEVFIWARKNGIDIPNSATRKTISGNGVYDVAAWNFVVSMNANDYFQLVWATTDLTAKIDAPAGTAFCPAVPSLILTVTEAAL